MIVVLDYIIFQIKGDYNNLIPQHILTSECMNSPFNCLAIRLDLIPLNWAVVCQGK